MQSDFSAGSKPSKSNGRAGKRQKKGGGHIYSSKHIRQQQAKANNSKSSNPQLSKKKKNKNKNKKFNNK